LGFIFPPFEHGYMDYWIQELYNRIPERQCTLNNMIEHRHWHSNISLRDEVYDYRTSRDSSDVLRYEREIHDIRKYVDRLKAVITKGGNY